jgi:hypothetical protein
MAAEQEDVDPPDEFWPQNYYNYYTEIEDHFRQVRGTGLFMASTLDWALIETWKNAGVPLEAVLRGIDAAFEKWRSRKSRIQLVNSLAYCTQAVLAEAQAMAGLAAPARREQAPPFTLEDLASYLSDNAAQLRAKQDRQYEEIAAALEQLAGGVEEHYHDLEQLEQRLSTLEEKMIAVARTRWSDEDMFAARRELDLQLRAYRRQMTAEQLVMLEKQYLERKLLETAGLPRLSLFYLG